MELRIRVCAGQRGSDVVVRDRIELSTFRFSGGFAGPGPSTIGRLSGQDGAPLLAGVQDRRHISRTVVSTLLARPYSQMGATAGGSRHRQPGLIETLITQQRVRRDLVQLPRLQRRWVSLEVISSVGHHLGYSRFSRVARVCPQGRAKRALVAREVRE
jgi:hypothetical protein